MVAARVPDVVVLGAGVIGMSVAWRAAEAGLAVTLVDPAPGGGASFAAAGMLAPITEASYGEEDLLKLNLQGARAYPAFIAELEERSRRTAGYRRCGTLMVAADWDDMAVVEDLHRYHRELGLPVARLSGAECRDLEPALSRRVRGGLLVEDDHEVDNQALLTALLDACRVAGISIVTERTTGIRLQSGRVAGVETRSGLVPAGAVVVCLGAWSGSLEGLPREASIPVRPVKGQLVHLTTREEPALFSRNIRTPEVYLVSRGDGRMVVGATVEEMGFDLTVTAGAVRDLLESAYEVLPGIVEAGFVGAVAGLRPALPDNKPAVGPGTIDGLVWATGHYRNGVLLAPVTATAIAAFLASGEMPQEMAAFAATRFATRVAAS